MWTTNFSKIFSKNILFYMSSRLSKIRSVHTYVMTWTVYFGWICIASIQYFGRSKKYSIVCFKLLYLYISFPWLDVLIAFRLVAFLDGQRMMPVGVIHRFPRRRSGDWCQRHLSTIFTLSTGSYKIINCIEMAKIEKDLSWALEWVIWLSKYYLQIQPK